MSRHVKHLPVELQCVDFGRIGERIGVDPSSLRRMFASFARCVLEEAGPASLGQTVQFLHLLMMRLIEEQAMEQATRQIVGDFRRLAREQGLELPDSRSH